ncbi:peptidase c14 caspase catalytic subunit p20 [Colletotrichum camelliae]|nr:peptidase c14 caspase catalytic subunit p20 [Colletotrichum camelliae]
MAKLLKSHGFDVGNDAYVKTLFRETATRQNILEAWEALIMSVSRDDTVVIYYSGHGVCIESDEPSQKSGSPSKIQFIVPYDFDCSLTTWKGILDGELSLLLRRTTSRTRNVTYILDCCHSARLGRKLGDVSFEPKAFGLPKSLYTDLFKITEQLKQAGKLTDDHLETNRHAVRIAAAGTDETAWEYHDDGHNYMGLLTKNLDRALTKSSRQRSWRDIMLEVGVLVGQDYPGGNQHPRSAGPDNRKPFLMTTTATGALLATIWDEGYTIVHGGRVNGVEEGDTYTIVPFGSQSQSGSKVATARVGQVNAFAAVLSPTPKPSEFGSKREYITGQAVLEKRRTRWPIRLSNELHGHDKINSLLDQSTFLRRCGTDENPLLNLRQEQNKVFLHDNRGLQLAVKRLKNDGALEDVVERLLDHAKEYGQARSILSLRSGADEELLGEEVEIVLGVESDTKKTVLTRRSDS